MQFINLPNIPQWPAVPQPIPRYRGNGTINVSGIDPFGRTDATSVIQKCIDNALLNFGEGTQVVLPDGTFLAGDLELYGNVSLIGSATGTTKIKKKQGSKFLLTINPGTKGTADPTQNSKNSLISNIWFDGLSVDSGFLENNEMLMLNAVSDMLIDRCIFTAFESDAIYLASSIVAGLERHNERIRITNCLFDGINNQNRNGITIIDGTDIWIERNGFRNCTRGDMPGAIDFEPNFFSVPFARLRNISIVENVFENCLGAGAVVFAPQMGQSTLTTPFEGFYVERNRFISSSPIVFELPVAPTETTVGNDIRIRDNLVVDCARAIILDGVKDVQVTGNRFQHISNTPLIGLTNPCQDVLFSDNVWDRLDYTGGGGLAVFNCTRLKFLREMFIDCGVATGGPFGYCIDFNAGTMAYVTIQDCFFLSPNGKTTFAIQKEVGATFSAATNWKSNNTFGPGVIGDNFPARQPLQISQDINADQNFVLGVNQVNIGTVAPSIRAINALTVARLWTITRGKNGDAYLITRISGGAFALTLQDETGTVFGSLAGAGNWVLIQMTADLSTWYVAAKG